MAMLNLFVVLVVFNHAVTSSNLEDLYEAIAQTKNETAQVELSNVQLETEIKDQTDQYVSKLHQLLQVENSTEDEFLNIKQQIDDLFKSKLSVLYSERETLTNHSIPEIKINVHKIEAGLKWLKEDLALLQERSSDGDQEKCFKYLDDEVQFTGLRLFGIVTGAYGDKVKIALIELDDAIIDLKKARRTNNRLKLRLISDKKLFEETISDIKSGIEDVQNNLEKAKNTLAEFNSEYLEISKEVEELVKEYKEYEKMEEKLKKEAADFKSHLDGYESAIECYKKLELFAAE